MSKKIPVGLAEKQEMARQQTINAVIRAISELKAEGYDIRIKDLMERTGLSRSVFAKPHIRQMLVEHGVVTVVQEQAVPSAVKAKSHAVTLAEKDSRIAELVAENEALRCECELIHGKLFLLMQREN